jgi:hypothetical protein
MSIHNVFLNPNQWQTEAYTTSVYSLKAKDAQLCGREISFPFPPDVFKRDVEGNFQFPAFQMQCSAMHAPPASSKAVTVNKES